jgi:ABC-type glycerol-3-phosphate transport system substrate-binding protein
MNALRPFKPDEITAMGGAAKFMAPNWQTGLLPGDKRVWAIPWTSWSYLICYRKDLLAQAGIDPTDAFGTIQAADATIKRLANSSLEIPWLNTQVPMNYRCLLHIAASWIWASGGDIIDRDGTKALFNSPAAINGLKDWLETYRAVPDAYKKLSQQETFDLFKEGRAAAVLANVRGANSFMDDGASAIVRDNLGVAPVTDTPWSGGGSFVLWDDLRGNLEKERAALELVKFLSSKETHLRYCHLVESTPARIDALDEIYPVGNPARDAIMVTATQGRSYYNMPIWRRIEYQLYEEIGSMVKDATEHMTSDSGAILHQHLDPLAARLNITLGHS